MINIAIDLLQYQGDLDLEATGSAHYVYGLVRKKYLKATPEEMVRQLILLYLTKEKGYPVGRIRTEMGLKVNDMDKRSDVLVYNDAFEPILLIECKSAKVPISESTFLQIANYNKTLKVPYLLLTNGPVTCCCKLAEGGQSFDFLENIPPYDKIR
ncbi:MAG: type I restriction enzyme HsdR N-terminal domain-containing protein [Aureispira sp.]|nr:type I restriction enzyme HsdR N-terminal domain-containing protein [Aureispira sp.]